MIKPPPNILVIKSHKNELKRVEKFIRDIMSFYKFPSTYFGKVMLCISEATINSIVHGNKNISGKKVEVHVDCFKHMISVKITDEGEGFDHETVPDPTKEENLLKESGRGIHIIKSIANKVEFNPAGNSLQFQIECNE